MIGQGSPTASRARRALWPGKVFIAAVLALWCATTTTSQAQETAARGSFKLRFEWGGGTPTQWSGTITLNRGTFSNAQPLGLEADEPGSIWSEGGKLRVREPSMRSYDGVDVQVDAPLDAQLTIDFQPLDGEPLKTITVPLATLVGDVYRTQLDSRQNQLLLHRAPGDRLRVGLDRDMLVFEPEERFVLNLSPYHLGAPVGAEVRIHAELKAARGDRSFWSNDYTIHMPSDGRDPLPLPLEVPLPAEEGAYNLVITASRRTWLRGQLLSGKRLAERVVQLAVVARTHEPAPLLAGDPWKTVLEIDPANPRWWTRLQRWMKFERVPGVPRGPLGSGHADTWQHPLGPLVRLQPRSDSAEPSWQAYPLPVAQIGTPHVLEIEYPSDVPQHLGVSILEPDAAGGISPYGLHGGVYVARELTASKPTMLRYRLVFWPKTESPLLLLTNQLDDAPAVFGKIRVLNGPARLPRATPSTPTDTERLLAAYFERPLLPEAFSASDALDADSGQSVDDWQTFYEGTTRLVDYLNYVGYNGALLSVLADGSTIYPSRLLDPTPLYDTGMLATTGQDPVRKDVLELLLRSFDGAGLRLTPALHFSTPLPELEPLRRGSDPRHSGIEWVGFDGATWNERHVSRDGQAPYYNVLNPRVQQAMLDVIDELVRRYGQHPSFYGLALDTASTSFAQLPGAEWGFDDQTISEFEHDTGLRVPGEGAGRFNQRARFLLGPNRQAWLNWRADVLESFHHHVAERLASLGSRGQLILATPNMLDTHVLSRRLRPMLPRRNGLFEQLLLEAGFRPQRYADQANLWLLRPRRLTPPQPLADRWVDMEVNRVVDYEPSLSTTFTAGSLLYHVPQEISLPSFDAASPFGPGRGSFFVTQSVPSGAANRRRFAHQLALADAPALFDGGNLLPLGQEDEVRDLFLTYRQLPNSASRQVETVEHQPVTIRTSRSASDAVIYAVNDSPWTVQVHLELEAPPGCTIWRFDSTSPPQSLASAGGNQGDWQFTLEPFAVAAARLSSPQVRIRAADVEMPEHLRERLEAEIRELPARIANADQLPPLAVLENADFEQPATGGVIPGWSWKADGPGADVTVDSEVFHADAEPSGETQSKQSMRVATTSRGRHVTIRSQPFAAPDTGRLSVLVSLLAAKIDPTTEVLIGLEGTDASPPYHRFARLGRDETGERSLPGDWASYEVPLDDLGVDGPDRVCVRIDLIGPGTVWIDNVRLYDRRLSPLEKKEISKMVFSADSHLENNSLGDCLQLLESYWPQFLQEFIPPIERQVASNPSDDERRSRERAEKKHGVLERMKSWTPRFLR